MSESKKQSKSDSFEIIELAIEDVNTLTRAFNVIQEACEMVVEPFDPAFVADHPEWLLH